MNAHGSHTRQVLCRLTAIAVAVALVGLLIYPTIVRAQETRGSNTQPFAFGPDQTIIDLDKLVWTPLESPVV